MENQSNSEPSAVTQPRPWTDLETQILQTLAQRKARKEEIAALLPGRTYGAVKKRISMERCRQGVPRAKQLITPHTTATMLHPDDPGIFREPWQPENVAQSNARYLAALRRFAA